MPFISKTILCLLPMLALFASAVASASNIQCATTQLPAERVICDHAILNNEYDTIYDQQQNLIESGKIDSEQIAAWTQQRDACIDVSCIDAVFKQWKEIMAVAAAGETRSTPSQTAGVPLSPLIPNPSHEPTPIKTTAPTPAVPNTVPMMVTSTSGITSSEAPAEEKKRGTNADGIFGLIFLGLIVFIVLGIRSFIRSFANRCNRCKRRGAGRQTSKEVIGRRMVTKLKKVTDKHFSSPNNFNPTSTTQRTIAVPTEFTVYKRHYKCRYCDHRWFTTDE